MNLFKRQVFSLLPILSAPISLTLSSCLRDDNFKASILYALKLDLKNENFLKM